MYDMHFQDRPSLCASGPQVWCPGPITPNHSLTLYMFRSRRVLSGMSISLATLSMICSMISMPCGFGGVSRWFHVCRQSHQRLDASVSLRNQPGHHRLCHGQGNHILPVSNPTSSGVSLAATQPT